MTVPEYISYDELAFPDGCEDLNWAEVPGGHLNWVDYWMTRFEQERNEKQALQAHVSLLNRMIDFAKLDILGSDLSKRVMSMLHRIRNQHQIIEEQRTHINKLERKAKRLERQIDQHKKIS